MKVKVWPILEKAEDGKVRPRGIEVEGEKGVKLGLTSQSLDRVFK